MVLKLSVNLISKFFLCLLTIISSSYNVSTLEYKFPYGN